MKQTDFYTSNYSKNAEGLYYYNGKRRYTIRLNDDNTMYFQVATEESDNDTIHGRTMKIKTGVSGYFYQIRKTQINTGKATAEEFYNELSKDIVNNLLGISMALIDKVNEVA